MEEAIRKGGRVEGQHLFPEPTNLPSFFFREREKTNSTARECAGPENAEEEAAGE